MLIDRPGPVARVRESFEAHPVVTLTGPRQCGKTTLALAIAETAPRSTRFDLEAAVDRRRLATPEQTLGRLEGLVVIDEVQRAPALFETVRVLVDRPGNRTRFLLLGSASPALVRGVSESLAGRAGIVDLGGFDLGEVGAGRWRSLWLRGGFPRSFLARSARASEAWRESFVRTFSSATSPSSASPFRRRRCGGSWTIALYHGRTWNAAELARALGAGESAARRHLDVLAGAFMVRVLPPWFENLRKRQVKAPRLYVRDTGLLHTLLDVAGEHELAGHPKVGASFEGFAVEQVLAAFQTNSAYGWGTHAGAELDLLVTRAGRRYGFECKLADAPGTTRSMRVALADLGLEHLWVVYPGDEAYALDDRISALPVADVPDLAASIGSRAGLPPAPSPTWRKG